MLYMCLSLRRRLKMEQYSQYLMLVNSKNGILVNPFSSHSWEEEAFAEDGRGPLGGFVWPPRSYSCSFCKREFRSAQALGGHMNVHRKERANLKHTTAMVPQNHNKKHIRKESLDPGFFPSTLSPSRVSSIQELGQVSHDTNSDTKSYDYYQEFVVAHGNGFVETNLVLGFELESSLNTEAACKRQKTGVTPPILAGSMDGLDLELRLAR